MRIAVTALLCGATLAAQSWPTFFSAYEDGLDAQRRGDHALAVRAFSRAIALEPQPGARVKTYGLNFLHAYYPYLRLAESCLALGDAGGAEAALAKSRARGAEPVPEREALGARLAALRPARDSSTLPAPRPQPVNPAATGIQPAAEPQNVLPVPAAPGAGPAKSAATAAEPQRPAQTVLPGARPRAAAPWQGATPVPLTSLQPPPPSVQPSPAASQPPQSPWRSRGLGLLVLTGLGLGAAALRRWRRRGDASAAEGRPPSSGATTAAFPMDAEPVTGMDFGPFHAQRVLGRGGTATAYYGIHRETGAEVAIKVPHRHLVKDPDFRARFRREAALGAMLDHPRIVRIVDPGPLAGEPWLALRFIKGRTLEAHLATQGALPMAEALGLAWHLAEAIAYAHGKGVVHRDLKPANVMLSEQGPVVMDFGIARVLDTAMTSNTMFIGTPLYSAPESLLGPRVGPPADRYALGLILFEMLAGHPPFRGETPFQILEAQRSEPLPDLGRIRPETPPRLIRLLERLCAKAPEDRPEDMELLEILGELKGGWAPGGLRP
jgi:hypothetical protein